MRKQKMVIDVCMSNGRKSHSRALKTVSNFKGVTKLGLGEKDKGLIELEAEGVDPTKIIKALRKKMEKRNFFIGCFLGKCRIKAHVELVSVTPMDEKKEEKKEDKYVWHSPYYYGPSASLPQFIECRDPNPCAIM